MTRRPSAKSIRIGDAIVALLRDHGDTMTTKEIAEAAGTWDMEAFTSCPQDRARRAEQHDRLSGRGWTFVSCLAKPHRGQDFHDVPAYGRYDWVVHTVNRPLFPSDLQPILVRLVRDGQVIKTRLDRYNATVYSAPATLVVADDLEAMWAASGGTA